MAKKDCLLIFATIRNWGLQIIMYHSIADNPKDLHAVHPDAFAQDMEDLERHRYRVIALEDAIADLRRWRIPGRTLVLTFDDGYKDFLVNAAPVLNMHGLTATVFAPTGLLGGTATWDTYDKSKQLMTWDELEAVQKLGFDVASHTVSHSQLTRCDGLSLERELRGSLDALRCNLPKVVPVLAYPGGYYGKREMAAAREAGYIGAVGTASRWANYSWTNSYQLRRRRWTA